MGAAYLVFVISLVPTLLAYQRVKENAHALDNDRFDQITHVKQDTVERRAGRYVDAIVSVGAFVTATESIDAGEWNRFTHTFSVSDRFPGFQLLGFAEVVPSTARAAHEAKWRLDAGADYAIHPPGQRASYCPVVLLNKLGSRNRLPLGADAFADAALNPILERALKTGSVAISGRVVFPWFTGKSAERVVVVQPVFFTGRAVATPLERKAALRGYVFGVLDMPRMLEGVFESPDNLVLRVKVFDGKEPLPGHSLFTSGSVGTDKAQFLRETHVRVADREWLMALASSPAFEAGLHNRLLPIMLALGIALNLLLSSIVWARVRARIKAEELAEDLRQVQERDRLLERANNDAIWDWDIPAGRIEWNEALQTIFRHSAETIAPQIDWWRERLHSEDRLRVWNKREAAVQTGGESWSDEYRFRRGDGTFAYVIDRGFIVRDQQGIAVRMIGSMVDISAQREAEAALAAEKERLAVTLRSISDGVIATNIEGRVTVINKHAENLTGWELGDAIGKPLPTVFKVVHQRTRQSFRNPVSQVLASGEIVDLPDQSMLLSRTGAEQLIAASAAPIRDLTNKIIGSVLVFRDITDQQAIMEERLRESKLDSLATLAGGIAHDFNNILTAVIGNISFARLFCQPGEKQFERLEEAERAAMRAQDLATQLLTFAKGGAPVRQTASLTELIRESTRFALRGSNVRYEFQPAPGLWPVEVDQGQFSHVIQNLVINSAQAMPTGGVVRVLADNVTLTADSPIALPPGRYCCITVQDHGVGIPPEHLSKIFDPYFTTKEKGAGLGLATSYSIVKKHDGIMTVDSSPGVGSKFHVYLPASANPVEPAPPAPSAPVEGQGRILVMDDEELIRELSQSALEFLGYQVDTVADGEACIQAYLNARAVGKPYAAVIMDLTIPGGMGGKEVIQRLLGIDPDVRAIVSSGYSHGPEMSNYTQHGFRGRVGKPYKVEELARELSAVLGGK